MTRPMAWASVVALFAIGILVGALGMLVVGQGDHGEQPFEGRPPGPGPGPPRHLDHLAEALDLEPEQARRLEAIFEESRAEADEIRRETRPRLHALMERTREQVDEILTPEQRATFEKMNRRQRRRVERMLFGPRPRQGGPPGRDLSGPG